MQRSRVRRQVNDLNLQVQERLNRHRQDASVELARLQTELAQLDENQVVRDDAVKRTTLVSPVNGLVKQIRTHTVGGVIGGLPGGILGSMLGGAGRALSNPGRTVAQLAAIERIASKFDTDLANGVKGFLSGGKSAARPPPCTNGA